MANIRSAVIFRVVSLILSASLILADVSYASCLNDHRAQSCALAGYTSFQNPAVKPAFQMGCELTAAILEIANYHFGDVTNGIGPLPIDKFEDVAASPKYGISHLLSGIDVSGIIVKDGVAMVPYSSGGHKYIIQIAPKNLLQSGTLIGNAEEDLSGRFAIEIVRDDIGEASSRELSVIEMGYAGSPGSVSGLVDALRDADLHVRIRAAMALSRIGAPDAIPGLVKALTDKDRSVRERSAAALDNLNWKPSEQDENIYYLIAKEEWDGLIKIGKPVIPHMIAALDDRDTRCGAAMVLGGLGGELAVSALMKALKTEGVDDVFRINAASALGKIGDVTTVPIFTELLDNENEDWNIRVSASRGLGRIGDSRAIPALVKGLMDRSGEVFRSSAAALDSLGWKPSTREEMIYHLVAKEEWDELAALGADAIPAIIRIFRARGYYAGEGPAEVLSVLTDRTMVPAIIEILRDPDFENRQWAAEVLDNLGWKPSTQEEAIYYLIAEEEWDEVVKYGKSAILPLVGSLRAGICDMDVAETLDKIGWKPATEEEKIDYIIASTHLESIDRSGPVESSVRAVVKALRDNDYYVRLDAARVLEGLGWSPLTEEDKISYLIAKRDWAGLGLVEPAALVPAEKLIDTNNLAHVKTSDKGIDIGKVVVRPFLVELDDILEGRPVYSSESNREAVDLLIRCIREGERFEIEYIPLIFHQETEYGGEEPWMLHTIVDNPSTIRVRALGTKSSSSKIRQNILQIEADGIVSSLIAIAARIKKDNVAGGRNERLYIGFAADWIPGYGEQGSLTHMAVSPLLAYIKTSLTKALEAMGLNNAELVYAEKSDELAGLMLAKVRDTNTKMSNVVVIGSRKALSSEIYDPLRSTADEEGALLAGIDSTELETYANEHRDLPEELVDLNILEILSIVLRVASGREPPDMPGLLYDHNLKMLIFLPRAQPVKYEILRDKCLAEARALQAA